MATAKQIKALIESHLDQDEDRFVSVAMQVAAHAARQGHGRVAQDIKQLIDDAKKKAKQGTAQRPIPIATPRGDLAGLLAVSYPKTRLSDMVLAGPLRQRLDRILREHRSQEKLRAHGLRPRRKVLLVGPPGTGKTMTASALAGELHLPIYVIQLHGLITKYMGETAAKLRLVFDALAEHRGIYLFDEFDAIGGERAAGTDVGEIRRVLNSFLQFLDQDDSPSIIVAATNHPAALDKALFRRFDDVIVYDNPGAELILRLLHNCLAMFDTKAVNWEQVLATAQELSYADVARACEAAAKTAVLADTLVIQTDMLEEALAERSQGRS